MTKLSNLENGSSRLCNERKMEGMSGNICFFQQNEGCVGCEIIHYNKAYPPPFFLNLKDMKLQLPKLIHSNDCSHTLGFPVSTLRELLERVLLARFALAANLQPGQVQSVGINIQVPALLKTRLLERPLYTQQIAGEFLGESFSCNSKHLRSPLHNNTSSSA